MDKSKKLKELQHLEKRILEIHEAHEDSHAEFKKKHLLVIERVKKDISEAKGNEKKELIDAMKELNNLYEASIKSINEARTMKDKDLAKIDNDYKSLNK